MPLLAEYGDVEYNLAKSGEASVIYPNDDVETQNTVIEIILNWFEENGYENMRCVGWRFEGLGVVSQVYGEAEEFYKQDNRIEFQNEDGNELYRLSWGAGVGNGGGWYIYSTGGDSSVVDTINNLIQYGITDENSASDVVKTQQGLRVSGDSSKVLYFINYARMYLNVVDDDAYIPMSVGYLIIYIVLIVFTVMFTIRYMKRVIYIAFLTLIAPLVALTYPIDKIKDRKSTSI